ncbi:hypothetical protein Clopa_1837 [Clostridium pasteurianum BC1]|uniref:Uncharacterized protein n=1 Tax=Clostridium pasteurianum BC1 TaxID=86416 RepID=R4K887_CLOPA|nr:hypothetical protein Clopa_1837 [Clostridium pasteurianum BC1]
MTSRCNIPPPKGRDNSDASLDNSSKLGGNTNSHQVRFIDIKGEIIKNATAFFVKDRASNWKRSLR